MSRGLVCVALCAGCGDGIARADASGAEVLGGLVTVRVLVDEPGPPIGDLPVFFQAADQSLELATHTEPDGTANAFVAPGGFVTIVGPALGVKREVWTYADVQPGDRLVLDLRVQLPTARIDVPLVVPPDPEAMSYELHTGCEQLPFDGEHPSVQQLRDCEGGVADMLVVTFPMMTPRLDQALNFLYAEGESIGPGWSVALSGAYAPLGTSTVTIAGIPDGVPYSIVHSVVGRHERLYATNPPLIVTADQVTGTVRMPLPAAARLLTELRVGPAAGPSTRTMVWEPAMAATTIDLPSLAVRRWTVAPSFDVATQTVSWSEDAAGELPDAAIVRVEDDATTWTMIAPRTAEPRIALPQIPFLRWSPDARVAAFSSIGVTGGYPTVRTNLLGLRAGRPFPIEGASGHASIEDLP